MWISGRLCVPNISSSKWHADWLCSPLNNLPAQHLQTVTLLAVNVRLAYSSVCGAELPEACFSSTTRVYRLAPCRSWPSRCTLTSKPIPASTFPRCWWGFTTENYWCRNAMCVMSRSVLLRFPLGVPLRSPLSRIQHVVVQTSEESLTCWFLVLPVAVKSCIR